MLQMRNALEIMENEIQFTNVKFEMLCDRLAAASAGEVSAFFFGLSEAVRSKDYQSIGVTRKLVDRSKLNLPPAAFFALEQLIDGFGKYDLNGQIRQIRLAKETLSNQLERDRAELAGRCRVYELLGLCTGIAVTILVI